MQDPTVPQNVNSLFIPRKPLLVLFVLSLPLQTISLSGTPEGEVGLKIYNIVFVFLFCGSINYRAQDVLSPTSIFGSVSLFFLSLYLIFVMASITWATEPTTSIAFSLKIIFVSLELFFFANLFFYHPQAFYPIRFAFELSGIIIFFGLLFQIQRMGLWDYLITSSEVANVPQAKNQYFGNLGLTFGGGKNLLGSWEAIVAILAYIHYSTTGRFQKRAHKFFILAAFLCSATTVFLTLSRTSILAFLLSLYIFHLIRNPRLNVKLLVKTFIVGAIFFGIILSLISTSEIGIFGHLTNVGTSSDTGASDRLALWGTAYEAIRDRPYFGQGIGNGFLTFGRYQTPGITGEDNFHNLFLQNFVELGLLGGIIFLIFWFSSVYFLYKAYKSNSEIPKEIVLSTLLINIAYSIMAMFQFKGGEPDIWLFIAINIALQLLTQRFNRFKSRAFHTLRVGT